MTAPALIGPFGMTRMPHVAAVRLATRLKAVATPTRLQILDVLYQVGDKGCGAPRLAREIGYLAATTVTHNLDILVRAGLVRREREGMFQVYRLDRAAMSELVTLLIPGGTR